MGGHYWTPASSDDPWNSDTVYQSKSDGSAQGQVTVDCGYALADVLIHAIVVHDSEGTRIACGVIGSLPPDARSRPSRKPCCATPLRATVRHLARHRTRAFQRHARG